MASLALAEGAEIIDLDSSNALKFTLSKDTKRTIKFDSKDYALKPESISEAEIKISISDSSVTIQKEQSSDIDLNKDQKTDLTLSYLAFVSDVVTLEAKRSVSKSAIPDISSIIALLKANIKFIGIGIGAFIVLIIILVLYSKSGKNPEKLYRKAEDLHREAKEFHDDGDDETAAELYEKAEELREKARQIEN